MSFLSNPEDPELDGILSSFMLFPSGVTHSSDCTIMADGITQGFA